MPTAAQPLLLLRFINNCAFPSPEQAAAGIAAAKRIAQRLTAAKRKKE